VTGVSVLGARDIRRIFVGFLVLGSHYSAVQRCAPHRKGTCLIYRDYVYTPRSALNVSLRSRAALPRPENRDCLIPLPPPHPPVAAAAARFAKALIPFIVRPFDTFVSYEM